MNAVPLPLPGYFFFYLFNPVLVLLLQRIEVFLVNLEEVIWKT